MSVSEDADFGDLSLSDATTTFTDLDSSEQYLVFYLPVGFVSGNGSAQLDVLVNTTVEHSIFYDTTGTSETGTPVYLLSSASSFTVTFSSGAFDVSEANASAFLTVLQVVDDTSLLNDCDINNDGIVDDEDIDFLNFALQTGAFGTVTDEDAIAMFDVDGDDDVDTADRDMLVEHVNCLNTLYGDTDLDGDVDDSDLGTLFSNYTGPIGRAGGKLWADGDTDGDGDVDDSDLGTAFNNYTE
ncbi:MAG: hypothetical protein ACE37H_06660 [Phycisphaeraceae bacterium]